MCTCIKPDCGRPATFAAATALDGRLASIEAFDGLCGRCHQIDHRAAVKGTFFFVRVGFINALQEVELGNRKVVSGRRNHRGDLCSIDGCTNRPGAYELHDKQGHKFRICTECAIAAMVVAIDTGNERMRPLLIAEARQEQGPELLRTHSDAGIAHQATIATASAPVGKNGQLVVPIQTGARQGQLKERTPKKPERKQRAKSPRKPRPAKATKPARKAPRKPEPTVTVTPANVTGNPAQTIEFGARFLVLVTKHGFDSVLFEQAKASAYAQAHAHTNAPEDTSVPPGDILTEVRKLPGGPEAIARMEAAERNKPAPRRGRNHRPAQQPARSADN